MTERLNWWCLAAKSCPLFCDPMDCNPPGSSVHGITQARILEWVAISLSSVSSQPRDQTCVSCVGRQVLYHLSHHGSLQTSYKGKKRTDKPSGPFKYQDLSDYTVLENVEFMENHCDIYFKVQFPIFKFGILPDGKEPAACKACSCFHFLVSEWSRAKHHLYFCSLYY